MKLIREFATEIETVIEEGANGKKDLYINGIFMQTEAKNKNGRIYPKSIMQEKVSEYINEYVNSKRALGELEHPATPQINLDRVSHLITNLTFEGNDIYGKAKILDTPCGKIARGLIEGGAQLGVSSRGVGSVVNRNGINEVQNDFRLVTVDIVSQPSAHEAWVSGVMEGAEWVCENGIWSEQQIDLAKKQMQKQYNEETAIKLFEQFMRSLRG